MKFKLNNNGKINNIYKGVISKERKKGNFLFTVPHLMFCEVSVSEHGSTSLFVCILASSIRLYKRISQNANRTLCEVDGSKHGKQFGRSLDNRISISYSSLFQPVFSKLLQMVCLALCKIIKIKI